MSKLNSALELAQYYAKSINAEVWMTDLGDGPELHIAARKPTSITLPGMVVINLDEMVVSRLAWPKSKREKVSALVVSKVVDDSDPSVGMWGYAYVNLKTGKGKNAKTVKFEHAFDAVKAAFLAYTEALIDEAAGAYSEKQLDDYLSQREA